MYSKIPNRWQAIIWTNHELILWSHTLSSVVSELRFQRIFWKSMMDIPVVNIVPVDSFEAADALALVGTMSTLVGAHIDGLVQERRNSSVLTMELRLSCTNPSTYWQSDTKVLYLNCIGMADFA